MHHKGRSRQDYCTPPELLEAFARRYGAIEFDLAASPENAVCSGYFTEADDALVQPWPKGLNNWCNPPYADIRPWVRKAWVEHRQGVTSTLLLPAGVGSNWFRDFVDCKAQVVFLNGRITFKGATQPYPKDCMLVRYGPNIYFGYEVWTWLGR